jgi:hypothetical protein
MALELGRLVAAALHRKRVLHATLRALWPRASARLLLARRGAAAYRFLGEDELRATRRSDTLFVFGSGYSINDLTQEECERFEEHDTLAFNFFAHCDRVRVDYHLVREIAESDVRRSVWEPRIREYFDLIRHNPCYRETILLVQTGGRAVNSNRALALGLVPDENRLFLWRTAYGRRRLGRSFAEGLSHPDATIQDCINFGFLLGWTTIVLVGVDLYDNRYFWLGYDEARYPDLSGADNHLRPHPTAPRVVRTLAEWRPELERHGVALAVYNPRSLLAEVLPVYERAPGRVLAS